MRAQVAIVGGGFAGLSAAYHLVRERPSLDVILLEAGEVGCEASGRNTGMLGPGAVAPITTLVRRLGAAGAARVFGATLEAVQHSLDLIEEAGLACDLERNGQLVVARSDKQAASLREQARVFSELGFDVEWLGHDALREKLASPLYVGGLRYPLAANLDPLKLCRELATHARELVADRIVLATNAFTPRLGFLRDRVVPLHTHVVRTEPLGFRIRELGWAGCEGVIEARRFFSYFRLTAQGALLLGGGAPLYTGGERATDRARFAELEREIATIFPALDGVAIERSWSGVMGFTLDRMPVVGDLVEAPGVLHAGAWCGHGVALALASGETIADLVASRRTPRTELPWIRGSAPWLPPDPLRGIGIHAYLAGLGLADRLDTPARPERRAPARKETVHAHLPQ